MKIACLSSDPGSEIGVKRNEQEQEEENFIMHGMDPPRSSSISKGMLGEWSTDQGKQQKSKPHPKFVSQTGV